DRFAGAPAPRQPRRRHRPRRARCLPGDGDHPVTSLRLMCVFAHPDDESLGTGGTLAKYAAEGVETYLVTATRGERGRFGDGGDRPPPEVVGATREAEPRAAARVLGIRDVTILG